MVAAFSGFWWLKWARLKTELKVQVWRYFGRFSSLVCVGCICGIIAWSSRTRASVAYFTSFGTGIRDDSALSLLSTTMAWIAVYNFFYAVEVMCLSLAKLIVLDRLTEHVVRGMQRELAAQGQGKVWYGEEGVLFIGRCLAAAVLLSGVVGLLANIAAAVYKVRSSEMLSRAAAACDSVGAHTNTSLSLQAAANSLIDSSELGNSVQNISEVVALVIIVAAYLCIGPLCLHIVRKAQIFLGHARSLVQARSATANAIAVSRTGSVNMQRLASTGVMIEMKGPAHDMVDNTLQAAVAQRRRIIAACLVVIFTFLPRAAFNMLQSIADANVASNPDCSTCGTCQSLSRLIRLFINFTPEFQYVVIAISSPLPLAVSLFCMMSRSERHLMRFGVLRKTDVFATRGVERATAFARDRMHINLPQQSAGSPLLGNH